jgi:hypothetical protein
VHTFAELVDRCATFTLNALKEANEKIIDALKTSAATPLVKALQMVQLQKVILATGMFSLFEAMLQDGLHCSDGFAEASTILDSVDEAPLNERFRDLQLAVNVLNHGRGRSYDALVAKAAGLPFRVKLSGEAFFFEGDVSEIHTLVEVDDRFVLNCADVIRDVSTVIRRVRPDFFL